MSQIVDLFINGGVDYKGRTLDEMIAKSDVNMEALHDLIQFMFPLHEKSYHSKNAPILSEDDIKELSGSMTAKGNMCRCLIRFKQSLGLIPERDEIKISFWCHNGNHNLLRVTRVIRSLRLFGLDSEAKCFYDEVKSLAQKHNLSNITVEFWDNAINDPLDKSLTEKFLDIKRIDL